MPSKNMALKQCPLQIQQLWSCCPAKHGTQTMPSKNMTLKQCLLQIQQVFPCCQKTKRHSINTEGVCFPVAQQDTPLKQCPPHIQPVFPCRQTKHRLQTMPPTNTDTYPCTYTTQSLNRVDTYLCTQRRCRPPLARSEVR